MANAVELEEGAKEVARRLRAAGHEAYFAGGCVRDLLRGEAPKDFDVVTDAVPERVSQIFRRTVQVGASFGVVRVLIGRGLEYEVATYRRDTTYSDGRHPDAVVYSTSKEEDVQRRDFTINALLMDPERGEVIDLVGGRADLERGLIRAVGDPDARFGEDRLRMLRAVRFASRFGYRIEDATLAVIGKHAAAIRAVSVERIVAELEGVWASRDPALGFDLLVSTGLWEHVLPPVQAGLREQLARLPSLELEKRARISLAWAAIYSGVSDLEAQLYALKLSRADIRTIMRLVAARPLLLAPAQHRVADRLRLLLDREGELFLAFARVLGAELSVWEHERAELAAHPLPPLPLLGGEDLKKLGLTPGPHFKELLAALEIETLERRITTKDEAIAFVKRQSHI